jgi:hypothetical protein
MIRVVLIEIEGENQAQVDRMADLLKEQVEGTALFLQAAMDHAAASLNPTAESPLPEPPRVKVLNNLTIHGSREKWMPRIRPNTEGGRPS